MASLVTAVKSKLFIHSSQKSMHALDGAYASLLRGRSLDFEDLRPYEWGDQVRDIDWKATARFGEPLIKRTKATRMHTIQFVVDTGRGMRALAGDERGKRELAVLVTGALGYLTVRHGDDFSVIHGDADGIRRLAPGGTDGALERALRTIDQAIATSTAPNDREALLRYLARTIAKRMIVVIVTDEAPVTAETERLLRRLDVQHDLLWVTLRDADVVIPAGADAARGRRDVDSAWRVPDFVHGDEEIVAELAAQTASEAARRHELLRHLEISHAEIEGQDAAVPALLAMLNRRSHARL